ncbi:hypothetical protein DFJ74DRAFT_668046 [Hyaloraphidium curvatum]|nr:hypothetical protein DFJ74DRAFT_668046 [Hyaloraphidium curvatum]
MESDAPTPTETPGDASQAASRVPASSAPLSLNSLSLGRNRTNSSSLVSSESLLKRLESLSPNVGERDGARDFFTGPHVRSRTTSSNEDPFSQLALTALSMTPPVDRRPSTSVSLSHTQLELREIAREIKMAEVDLNEGAGGRKRVVVVAGLRNMGQVSDLVIWLIGHIKDVDIHVPSTLYPHVTHLLPDGSHASILPFPTSQPILPLLSAPADLLVSIGGDGTALRAAWAFQGEMPPMLAFRTDVSKNKTEGVGLGGRSHGVIATHLWRNYQATLTRIFGLAQAPPEKLSIGDRKLSLACRDVQKNSGYRILFRTRFACTIVRCGDTLEMFKRGIPGMIPPLGSSGASSSSGADGTAPPPRSVSKASYSAGLLQARDSQDDSGTTYHILNELIIDRGPSPYLSLLELRVSTEDLSERSTLIQADGIVIATPTGSTAYSLSAGGSIVHPDVGGILCTPIAPHELTLRPFILPEVADLRLIVPKEARAPAWASFDSRKRVPLWPGDEVRLRAGDWPVPCVCPDEGKDARTWGWEQAFGGASPTSSPRKTMPARRRSIAAAADDEESDSEAETEQKTAWTGAEEPNGSRAIETVGAVDGDSESPTQVEGLEDDEEDDEGTFGHFR